MLLKAYLMLRSARRVRLEARTTSMQAVIASVPGWPSSVGGTIVRSGLMGKAQRPNAGPGVPGFPPSRE